MGVLGGAAAIRGAWVREQAGPGDAWCWAERLWLMTLSGWLSSWDLEVCAGQSHVTLGPSLAREQGSGGGVESK